MSLTPLGSASALVLASSFYTAALEWPFSEILAREYKDIGVSSVPYNQLHTFLLEPGSVLREDTPTSVLLLLRLEDFIRFELAFGAGAKAPDACADALRQRTEEFLNVISRVSRLRLTVLICPSGRAAYDVSFLGNSVRVSEFKVAAGFRRQQRHCVIGWQEFETATKLQGGFNASADRLGHVPFSPEGLSALANYFVGQLHRMPVTVLSRNTGTSGSTDLELFLATLDTEIEIVPLTAEDEPKIIDLVRHTTHFINRLNCKWEAGAIHKLASGVQNGEAWMIRVRDRFGDYGLCGAITFGFQENVMQVGLWFLSCPVLGRQVEYAFLAWVARVAVERGANDIDIPFVRGRDNHNLESLLAKLAESDRARETNTRVFRLPVSGLLDRVLAQAPSPKSVKSTVNNLRTVEAALLRKAGNFDATPNEHRGQDSELYI
jgi:hypothetical protein